MFSDHATVDRTMWDTPYLDIYIGCETSGGGWSTLDGTRSAQLKSTMHVEMLDQIHPELGDGFPKHLHTRKVLLQIQSKLRLIYCCPLLGTIVRYWMRDLAGTEAMMDWPMADAGRCVCARARVYTCVWSDTGCGSFDAVTSTWLHIALVVTPTSIMTYEDGTRVAEQQ